jgi:glycosyltransferase involved in cell wall biosynthesis
MNNPIGLSIVITAHKEGALLIPTLGSVEKAVENLKTILDIDSEFILVLDNANQETENIVLSRIAEYEDRDTYKVITTTHGEAGEARNSGITVAQGEFVCCCDGDDLISSNFLVEAFKTFRELDNEKVILHVEHLLSFGSSPSIWHVKNANDPDVSVSDLLEANLWPSSSFAKRSTFQEIPYVSLPPKEGFGPEDWYWNILTTSHGYLHRTVPNTVFFYRIKRNSGVNSQHASSVLPYFNLDLLIENFPQSIPVQNSELIADSTSVDFSFQVRRAAKKILRIAQPVTWIVSQPAKDAVSRKIRRLFPKLFTNSSAKSSWVTGLEPLLKEATNLDPAISWPAFLASNLVEWTPKNNGYGDLLLSVHRALKDYNDKIVFAPWLGIGGADLVTANYLAAFLPEKVSLIATYDHTKTLHELIPQGVNFIQLPPLFLEFSPELQRRLIAQIVILNQPNLTLSINCFHITNALSEYSTQICQSTKLYLSFFAFDQIGDGYPVNPITDDAERKFLGQIEGIITDNTATKDLLIKKVGIPADKISVHLQPGFATTPKFRKYTAAYNDWEFSEQYPFKLLWPHRIDKEKRPEVLLNIAQEAQRRNLPIQVDVYGQRVLTSENDDLFDEFSKSSIRYKGEYSKGLGSLPTRDYHSILLTSENEGTPLVVVQAMLLSLPVIATAVGGLPALLEEGKAGLLVDHYSDTTGFVDAIETLINSRENRRLLITRAYQRAYDLHSWQTFTEETIQSLI